MNSENPRNQEFMQMVEKVLRGRSTSMTSIASTIGVSKSKISDIKRGTSSASKEMIDDLISAYPELQPEDQITELEAIKKRIEELEKDNAILKELVLRNIKEKEEKEKLEKA